MLVNQPTESQQTSQNDQTLTQQTWSTAALPGYTGKTAVRWDTGRTVQCTL